MKGSRDAREYVGELGRAIRRVREKAGFSQEKLAELADLHHTYIGAVERGERNLTIVSLHRLSAGLGLKPSALLLRAEAEIYPRGGAKR